MIKKNEHLPTNQKENIETLEESLSFSGKNQELTEKPLSDMMALVNSLNDIFKFPLGCKVRNRHLENGYIEMCAIDYRGALYLVNLEKGRSHWYTEFEITKQQFDPENRQKDKEKNQHIQTDIPDPKDVAVS
jgi:hypothetical protein